MIHFEIDKHGDLRFSIDPSVAARLEVRRKRVMGLLNTLSAETGSLRLPAPTSVLCDHPAAQGLLAYQEGNILKEQAHALIEVLQNLTELQVARLESGLLTVHQSQAYLPIVDTRGESILIDDRTESSSTGLDAMKAEVSAIGGESWSTFSAIVKTVSFVVVAGMPDLPYFSGSSNMIWGAMHMTNPASPVVLAESVTHEAAHFWLHAVEEVGEFAPDAWSDETWVSPWRDDPRPVAGIVHGVHVFSCAAVVMAGWLAHPNRLPARVTSVAIAQRIATLIAQVEEGLAELQRNGTVTAVGMSIAEASRARLIVPVELVPADIMAMARDAMRVRRREKVARWATRGFAFRA